MKHMLKTLVRLKNSMEVLVLFNAPRYPKEGKFI